MALQESPSLNQTHHLFSDTTKALSLWTFVLRDILYVECLPSPSTVRQEWSGFHFLLKGSAKLRSPEPPQAGGWASLPPQVTLRLGNFKNRKCPISTRAILRSTSLFWFFFFFYLFKRNQVGAGDEQFGQVFDPVLLLSLELIFLLQQLRENLFLCGCCLSDWRNLGMRTSDLWSHDLVLCHMTKENRQE